MRVICVIVTYNRLDLLIEAFQAVSIQTTPPDLVVIVDNCSSDGTRDWLMALAEERADVSPVFLDSNCGGAGGFYYGIKTAYELGADWIWTMDDDTVPNRDALEGLIHSGIIGGNGDDSDVGFLASEVNWKDGARHQMNVPGVAKDWNSGHDLCQGAVKISYASFVSILINRDAIQKVGFPVRQFFIHGDDVEFTLRVTAAGFAAFYVSSSKVTHNTETNCGVTLEAIGAAQGQLQRWEYTLRNLVAINRRREFGWFREPARLCYLFVLMMRNRTPLKIRARLMWAGLRGLCMCYEKWIEYPVIRQT
jgi:GT2 family glycosyltransferase